tara:strand:+ start:176 stop:310 length:135 start_codon:yes stop_codon:yes gene_type:complete
MGILPIDSLRNLAGNHGWSQVKQHEVFTLTITELQAGTSEKPEI